MYMRFGNILNELLLEWYGDHNNPFKTDDLILSVADDSPDYFVMVVNSIKLNRVLGTFTVTLQDKMETDELHNRIIEKEAVMNHKFTKIPNKEIMLQALGKIPEALATYMNTFDTPESAPRSVRFEPNSPVEKRLFAGREFEDLLWNVFRNSDSTISCPILKDFYYRTSSDRGGHEWRKRWVA